VSTSRHVSGFPILGIRLPVGWGFRGVSMHRLTLTATFGVAGAVVLSGCTSGSDATGTTGSSTLDARPTAIAQSPQSTDSAEEAALDRASKQSSSATAPTQPVAATLRECIDQSDGSDLSIWRCGRKHEFANDPERFLLSRWVPVDIGDPVQIKIVPSYEVCLSLPNETERDECKEDEYDYSVALTNILDDRRASASPSEPTSEPTQEPTQDSASPTPS